MLQFCKCVSLVFSLLHSFSANCETVESEPPYDSVVPVNEWSRYSCDSARSLSGWTRWWRYIRLKHPVTMHWIDGLVLGIYPGNEVCRALYVNGIYDPNYVVVVNKFLSEGGTFIDVGANIGYYSLLASKVVGNSGHIIAIEPSSRDYNRLLGNVKNNNLEKLISTHNLAITDEISGYAKLSIACEERSAINTIGTEFSFKSVDKICTETVKVISIDELLRKYNLSRVDVLKLDIEGSELKALLGARGTIEKFHPAIMLGVNVNSLKACDTNCEEIQKILTDLGYRIYKIVESPKFALELIENLSKEREKVVFCLYKDVSPPELPQPREKSFPEKVDDFLR